MSPLSDGLWWVPAQGSLPNVFRYDGGVIYPLYKSGGSGVASWWLSSGSLQEITSGHPLSSSYVALLVAAINNAVGWAAIGADDIVPAGGLNASLTQSQLQRL